MTVVVAVAVSLFVAASVLPLLTVAVDACAPAVAAVPLIVTVAESDFARSPKSQVMTAAAVLQVPFVLFTVPGVIPDGSV